MQTIAGSVSARQLPWTETETREWSGVVLLASAVLLAAAIVGPGSSWDLRNYHLYNGYAWLHGRIGTDLAPAQAQTFFAPLLDIGYALLLRAFNHAPRVLAMSLAVPHAIAAGLLLILARRLLPPWQAGAATLIGVTGAAALPTVGTAMSEMAPGACILGAVLLLVRADRAEPTERACFAAGILGGAAVGMQLTAAPYALGLIVMLPLSAGPDRRAEMLRAFCAGALIGAVLTGGFWWWRLWQRFGNPVFPYFNNIFHSPWGLSAQMSDLRFMPRSAIQALTYPLYWAFEPQTLVSELPTSDPRIALGSIAALAIAIRAARPGNRLNRAITSLAAFWALSFVAWEASFSILRYLATLELFSGILVLAALQPLLTRLSEDWQRACSAMLVLVLIAVTDYPDWGRVAPGGPAVSVVLPVFPPNTLVMLLDPSPTSYVAAFAAPDVRFVGANNNLLRPGDRTLLARQVEAAIRTHSGPLWGLEMPHQDPGVADVTLRAYALHRADGCVPVRSNLDQDGILACPLMRAAHPPIDQYSVPAMKQ